MNEKDQRRSDQCKLLKELEPRYLQKVRAGRHLLRTALKKARASSPDCELLDLIGTMDRVGGLALDTFCSNGKPVYVWSANDPNMFAEWIIDVPETDGEYIGAVFLAHEVELIIVEQEPLLWWRKKDPPDGKLRLALPLEPRTYKPGLGWVSEGIWHDDESMHSDS